MLVYLELFPTATKEDIPSKLILSTLVLEWGRDMRETCISFTEHSMSKKYGGISFLIINLKFADIETRTWEWMTAANYYIDNFFALALQLVNSR